MIIKILTLLSLFILSLFSEPLTIKASDNANIQWGTINPSLRFRDSSTFIAQILGGTNPGISYTGAGLLSIAILLGGLLLLVILILGGFQMLTNPTSPEAQDKGKKQITYAIAGFLLLFASYWIIEIIQIIFGVAIVSNPG